MTTKSSATVRVSYGGREFLIPADSLESAIKHGAKYTGAGPDMDASSVEARVNANKDSIAEAHLSASKESTYKPTSTQNTQQKETKPVLETDKTYEQKLQEARDSIARAQRASLYDSGEGLSDEQVRKMDETQRKRHNEQAAKKAAQEARAAASDYEKRYQELRKKNDKEAGGDIGYTFTGPGMPGRYVRKNTAEEQAYDMAALQQKKAARAYDVVADRQKYEYTGEALKDIGTFFNTIGRAVKETAGDPLTWMGGVEEAALWGTAKKVKDSDMSKDAQQAFLSSLANAQQAASEKNTEMGDLYRWSEIFGQSMPFSAQFFATGGGGASMKLFQTGAKIGMKNALRGITKAEMRNIIRQANNGWQYTMRKNLGVLADDVLRANMMSLTLQNQQTMGNVLHNYVGDVSWDDNKGEYVLDGGQGLAKSIYKGVTAQTIENYTEMLGAHFPTGGKVRRALQRSAIGNKKAAAIPLKAWEEVTKRTSLPVVRKVLQKTGFNGYVGESMEEEAGIVLNALLLGELPDDMWQEQKDIWGGMLLSSAFMGLGGSAIYHGTRGTQYGLYKMDERRLASIDEEGASLIPEWDEVKNRLDNSSNTDILNVARAWIKNRNNDIYDNGAEADVIARYAIQLLRTRGHNLGRMAEHASTALLHNKTLTMRKNADGTFSVSTYNIDEEGIGSVIALEHFDTEEEANARVSELRKEKRKQRLSGLIDFAYTTKEGRNIIDTFESSNGKISELLDKDTFGVEDLNKIETLQGYLRSLYRSLITERTAAEREEGKETADKNFASDKDIADIQTRVDTAKQGYDAAVQKNGQLADFIANLEKRGAKHSWIIDALQEDGSFTDEEVRAVAEYYNALACKQGYIDGTSESITQRAVWLSGEKAGTARSVVNGESKQGKVVSVVDAQGNNFSIVAGNVAVDENGVVTAVDGQSDVLVLTNDEGETIIGKVGDGFTFAGEQTADEYRAQVEQTLQAAVAAKLAAAEQKQPEQQQTEQPEQQPEQQQTEQQEPEQQPEEQKTEQEPEQKQPEQKQPEQKPEEEQPQQQPEQKQPEQKPEEEQPQQQPEQKNNGKEKRRRKISMNFKEHMTEAEREELERHKKDFLRNTIGQANMGIPPEAIYSATRIAFLYIKAGARTIEEIADVLIEEIGDMIRPYIAMVYAQLLVNPEIKQMGIRSEMTPFEDVDNFDAEHYDDVEEEEEGEGGGEVNNGEKGENTPSQGTKTEKKELSSQQKELADNIRREIDAMFEGTPNEVDTAGARERILSKIQESGLTDEEVIPCLDEGYSSWEAESERSDEDKQAVEQLINNIKDGILHSRQGEQTDGVSGSERNGQGEQVRGGERSGEEGERTGGTESGRTGTSEGSENNEGNGGMGTPEQSPGRKGRGRNADRGSRDGAERNGTHDSSDTRDTGRDGNGERDDADRGEHSGQRGVGGDDAVRPDRKNDSKRVGLEDPNAEKQQYHPKSSNPDNFGSVIPSSQAEVTQDALDNIRDGSKKIEDVDDFVADRLGYKDKVELYKHLSAEQIDGVALAINQIEKGSGFIIGDMTGIGKGRQAAAIIRYAVLQHKKDPKNTKKPIFFTQKPDLFTDLYRDLKDIGSEELVPFIFASKSDGNITGEEDSNGKKPIIHKVLGKKDMEAALRAMLSSGELPQGYDFAVATYSQIQNGTIEYELTREGVKRRAEKRTDNAAAKSGQLRRNVIEKLCQRAFLILDESHTAAGDSNTGLFMQKCLEDVKSVTFLSATYAKRPDNMLLYAGRTSISEVGLSPQEILMAIKQGGTPLQEIMSRQLVQAGQLIRRERDFTGVNVDWIGMPGGEEQTERINEQYDKIAVVLQAIMSFSNNVLSDKLDELRHRVTERNRANHTHLTVSYATFPSILYSVVNQILFSIKAEAIADLAIEDLRAGRKPVISYNNTLEGMNKRLSDSEYDEMPSFENALAAIFDNLLNYAIKEGDDVVETGRFGLTHEEMTVFEDLTNQILALVIEAPMSPVDIIRERIEAAGYKTGEISGRSTELRKDEDTGKYKLRNRSGKDKDKKGITSRFNNGDIDCVLLNKSGSTGISMHASSRVKDQRQRVMIGGQFQNDINDEVQVRGRIDRTGQVCRGAFKYLLTSIPCELRLQMMFKMKLKSLDANTTSSQNSEFNKMEVSDLLNKYGDNIMYNYLMDNYEMNAKLGFPLGVSVRPTEEKDVKKAMDDAAQKAMRRIALLSVSDQTKMFDEVTAMYDAYITMLDEMGENDLKMTVMPLDAKTEHVYIWEDGSNPDSGNPFADNIYAEECDVRVLQRPMKRSEIDKVVHKLVGDKEWDVWVKEQEAAITEAYNEKYERTAKTADEEAQRKAKAAYDKTYEKERNAYLKKAEKAGRDINSQEVQQMATNSAEIAAGKARDDQEKNSAEVKRRSLNRLIDQRDTIINALKKFPLYQSVNIPRVFSAANAISYSKGIFLGFKMGTGYTPGTVVAIFATTDSRRRVEIPLSRYDDFAKVRSVYGSEEIPIDEWNERTRSASSAERRTAFIITGNLMKAVVRLSSATFSSGKPRIVQFTTSTGEQRYGILLPEGDNIFQALPEAVPVNSQRLKDRIFTKVEGAPSTEKQWGVARDVSYKSVDGDVEISTSGKRPLSLFVKIKKKRGDIIGDEELRAAAGSHMTIQSSGTRIKIPFYWDSWEVHNKNVEEALKILDILSKHDVMVHVESQMREKIEGRAGELIDKINSSRDVDLSIEDAAALFNHFNKDKDIASLMEKVLPAIKKLGIKIKVSDQGDVNSTTSIGGYYRPSDGTITYSRKVFGKGFTPETIANIILHEMIHAVTHSYLYAYEHTQGSKRYSSRADELRAKNAPSLSPEQEEACKTLIEIYDRCKGDATVSSMYGMTTVHEMVAELSKPEFRMRMKALRLWRRIVNAITRLFSFSNSEGYEKTDALTETEEALGRLLDSFDENFNKQFTSVLSEIDSNIGLNKELDAEEQQPLSEDDGIRFSIRKAAPPTKTSVGYKVFYLKDGQLYPPMVANPDASSTPVGVWLDADEAPIIGQSKTGRNRVKAGGKGTQGGSGTLAYRPGWHLGVMPYAKQFNRKDASGARTLFPKDFVWAEVEYADDMDYQEEAMSYGRTKNNGFSNALAGLPRVPENGSYRYRTNPDPSTDEWIITGAMRVNRLLTPSEVDDMVRAAGREPQKREAGSVTDKQIETLNRELGLGVTDIVKAVAAELQDNFGVEVEVVDSLDDVQNEKARKAISEGQDIKGWYDLDTGKVYIYAPNIGSRQDAMATYAHEVIAHKGMRGLLGEKRYKTLCERLGKVLTAEQLEALEAYSGESAEVLGDEYVAHIAEMLIDEKGEIKEPTTWEKVKGAVREFFRDMFGLDLTDADIRYMLWRSGERLHRGKADASTKAQDAEDVERTLLHEAVAHHGLRSLLGSKFDDTLDDIYNSVSEETRQRIDDMAVKEGISRHAATEEYLADLAENMDFSEEGENKTLWQKIKDAVSRLLKAVGFKQDLTDDEMRDMLRRSYNNLSKKPATSMERLMQIARNGNGAKGALGQDGYTRFIRNVWKGLSKDMADMVTDIMTHSGGWDLHRSVEGALIASARNPERYPIDWNKVRDDMQAIMAENGNKNAISVNEAKMLVYAAVNNLDLNNPEHVMRYNAFAYQVQRNGVIDNEEDSSEDGILFRRGDDLSAAAARNRYESYLRTVRSKLSEAFTDYMVSFRKLQDEIAERLGDKFTDSMDAYNAENALSSLTQTRHEKFYRKEWKALVDAVGACAKVLGGKFSKAIEEVSNYAMIKHGLERNRVFGARDAAAAAKTEKGYKKACEKFGYSGTYEEWVEEIDQDLKDFYEHRMLLGEDVTDGRITFREYIEDMDNFISNASFGKFYKAGEDKSGILNLVDTDGDAIDLVESMETTLGDKTGMLWNGIKTVTGYTLQNDYDCGLCSRETFDRVSNMFSYYVPLRGFKEDMAEDVYDYLLDEKRGPSTGTTIMHAKRRKSLADDPFATMGAMATQSVIRGERNRVKQRFLRAVRAYTEELASSEERGAVATIQTLWEEKIGTDADGNPIWQPVFPDITEDMTADEVANEIASFNTDMASKAANGDARKVRNRAHIPYRLMEKAHKNEHFVIVSTGGQQSIIIINGNPRAAQAINGLTNPQHQSGYVSQGFAKINRFLSSMYTTYSPTFAVRNAIRDGLFAASNITVKENAAYVAAYSQMYTRVLGSSLGGSLWRKYRKDTLDTNDFYERCFKEFLENGGRTGYVELKNVDEFKKLIQQGVSLTEKRKKALFDHTFGLVEDLNMRMENVARFTVYCTSRRMGRSILRSVSDAKDVTVNFNRKGAGAKTSSPIGYVAEMVRSLYLFINPAIQDLMLVKRGFEKSPFKATALFVTIPAVMGYLMPYINAMLIGEGGDGDDDPNAYANLPEWVRRNNLCFYAGKNNFVTIPLPIFMRAFYGLGDIAAGYTVDENLKSLKPLPTDVASTMTQILPIDFLGEGDSPWMSLVPSQVKPVVEAAVNTDWTGVPIQKEETPWNKYEPQWKRAFNNENKYFVEASKRLNELGGGTDYSSAGGLFDISPAYANHILAGYLGGIAQTANDVITTWGALRDLTDENEFNVRNVPMAKAVFNQSDDKTAFYRSRQKYYHYREEYEKTNAKIKSYKEAGDILALNDILNSKEGFIWAVYKKRAVPDEEKFREARKNLLTTKEKKTLDAALYMYQSDIVKVIDAYDKEK